jgi:hypothetical protein
MKNEFSVKAELLDLRKIWDYAEHNAFTDLLRFRDRWFCTFREANNHISPQGKIRVLVSDDGSCWNSTALLAMPDYDMRDPKLSITPSGCLMLNMCAVQRTPSSQKLQSFILFSENGVEWSAPQPIGDPDCWLWRVVWHQEIAHTIGYTIVAPLKTRLYVSEDGIHYAVMPDDLCAEDFPNEATLAFRKDGSALCLQRRDAGKATALLGISNPPYNAWEWKDLGVRIGGPNLLILPDDRIIAAIRRYGANPWTSLSYLDPDEGTLHEFLALPSGGDTSYAGLCWHEEVLWVSYYSSHEEKASIYLAQIKISFKG